MTHDQTGLTSARADAPEIAALVQGFDAVQTFQSPQIFPRAGLESAVDAAHRTITPPDFPETCARPGRHHLDRPRVVFDPVHGLERPDRPEFCELAVPA